TKEYVASSSADVSNGLPRVSGREKAPGRHRGSRGRVRAGIGSPAGAGAFPSRPPPAPARGVSAADQPLRHARGGAGGEAGVYPFDDPEPPPGALAEVTAALPVVGEGGAEGAGEAAERPQDGLVVVPVALPPVVGPGPRGGHFAPRPGIHHHLSRGHGSGP